MRVYYVYMLASKPNGVLYVGVTRDLIRRVQQHQRGFSKFTTRYHVRRLVWFEVHHDIVAAISREKTIKKWRRPWKIALIETNNPSWRDLTPDIMPSAK